MKHKICTLLLTLVMAMSAGLFSACRQEKQPSGDVNTTDPNGQHGTPETPPAEEQATEGLHYTPIYGEDNETVIGYNVGVGEAVDEEKIVIPAEHDGLPVLRIGMPEEFFGPVTNQEGAYNYTDKFLEECTAYFEELGYDPRELEGDKENIELFQKILYSFYQQYTFTYSKAKTIEIPNGVTEIGLYALAGSDIESLYLPESVTKIENLSFITPFNFCNNLTKIEISEKNPVYHSEGNCIIETATKTVVAGCKASVIPEGTLSIGMSAFSCVGSIGTGGTAMEVYIPKSVTSIQNYAFFQCVIDRIVYGGTIEEWNRIDKLKSAQSVGWRANGTVYEVVCTNGTLTGSDIG